jgi:hypothetical protein
MGFGPAQFSCPAVGGGGECQSFSDLLVIGSFGRAVSDVNQVDGCLTRLSSDTRVFGELFDVPFSCHASYQSCNDPRDWKVGVAL